MGNKSTLTDMLTIMIPLEVNLCRTACLVIGDQPLVMAFRSKATLLN